MAGFGCRLRGVVLWTLQVACGPFLQKLLEILLDQGLLIDEMNPRNPKNAFREGACTFLGVARPAGSPFFRRIDFKVIPHR